MVKFRWLRIFATALSDPLLGFFQSSTAQGSALVQLRSTATQLLNTGAGSALAMILPLAATDSMIRGQLQSVLLIVLLFIGVLISLLVTDFGGWSGGTAVRHAAFQVVSIVTTTGFCSTDFEKWNGVAHFAAFLMLVAMFTGGSAGSTGGGMKAIRLYLLAKAGEGRRSRCLRSVCSCGSSAEGR